MGRAHGTLTRQGRNIRPDNPGSERTSTSAGLQTRLRIGFLPLIALALFLALIAGAIIIIIIAGRNGATSAPPEVGPFSGPERAHPTLAYDVQRVEGNRLTVTSGTPPDVRTFDISLPADIHLDVLEPVAVETLNAGDWVTIVGITNAVKNLSIRLVVAVPNPGQRGDDGLVRSAVGFIGHEGARDSSERPVLWGTVTAKAGGVLTIETRHGPATAEIGPGTPLRRLRPGTLSDLHDGDRLALFATAGGEPDFGRGALVRTGGAR